MSHIISNLKTSIVVTLMIAMLAIVASVPAATNAQSQTAVQSEIQRLLQVMATLEARVAELQEQLNQQNGATGGGISVDSTVRTTDQLWVRSSAGVNTRGINSVPAFTEGQVVGGPRYADGYTWWQIEYDNGLRGWSAADWLTQTQAPTYTPDPDSTDNEVENTPSANDDERQAEIDRLLELVVELQAEDEQDEIQSEIDRLQEIVNDLQQGDEVDPYQAEVEELMQSVQDQLAEDRPTKDSMQGQVDNLIEQIGQLKNNTDQDGTSYDIDIEQPRTGSSYELGDTFVVTWDQDNLPNERGVVTLEGGPYNVQRHIKQYIAIGDERASVRIPADDRYVVPGDYELKVWVSYLKDGDPKGVSDAIDIEIVERNVDYDIDIEQPRTGSSYQLGDTFVVTWDQDNLPNERGVVTLEGGPHNVQRHIKQYVAIGDERASVRIPADDRYVVPGDYELKVWVSYLKDGDPKGVSDTIDIEIDDESEEEDIEANLRANPARGQAPLATTFTYTMNGEKTCDTVGHLIDFGDGSRTAFNKPDGTCIAYEQHTDHVYQTEGTYNITLSACTEEVAKKGESCPLQTLDTTTVTVSEQETINITQMIDDLLEQMEQSSSATSPTLTELYEQAIQLAEQLDSQSEETYKDIINEHHDAIKSSGPVSRGEYERALGVGAYEGSYPDGDGHSFRYHPQGEITVKMPKGYSGDVDDYVLVLTSYEPVKWNITGEGVDMIGRVLATGYYDQEVTGLPSNVPVDTLSHESGDNEYFYVHDTDSSNYDRLREYVQDKYQVRFTQFHDSYTQDVVEISGYKG